ncbi:MAG TPA: hypothetical protein VGS41_15060 [Chthonomonadales bacterium]|nr:hypothetical protein [Chthonomonadales bacterium]
MDFLEGREALPVSRILVGPGWQLDTLNSETVSRNHVIQGISRLLSVRNMTATTIETSAIPYDPK